MFAKYRAKKELIRAFHSSEIYKKVKLGKDYRYLYPQIHDIDIKPERTRYVFTLLNGMDPKEMKKKEYCFKQVFGRNIEIKGDLKKFVLTIKHKVSNEIVKYKYDEFARIIESKKMLMPIVCGKDDIGNMYIYDAIRDPNLLLFGQPGSGKSSTLHAILTTLIQYFPSDELQLFLGDFKQSEFGVYEGVIHVKSVSLQPNEISPALGYIKKQCIERGKLLKEYRVRHIKDIPKEKRPPFIVLVVDEFVMIKDDGIMDELLQIVSLGRAYGIYVILSMQRPSSTILSTDVRAMLTIRMGFRTVDRRNATMGETPGSEQISKDDPGKFILKHDDLISLRAPYLDEKKVEKIIKPYITDDWVNHSFMGENVIGDIKEDDGLGRLDDGY